VTTAQPTFEHLCGPLRLTRLLLTCTALKVNSLLENDFILFGQVIISVLEIFGFVESKRTELVTELTTSESSDCRVTSYVTFCNYFVNYYNYSILNTTVQLEFRFGIMFAAAVSAILVSIVQQLHNLTLEFG